MHAVKDNAVEILLMEDNSSMGLLLAPAQPAHEYVMV
jgi:hypothetical protein